MKSIKVLNIFPGVVSLSFGLLKFVSPFKGWYLAQIETSGLPRYTYAIGITAEIITGLVFLLPFLLSMDDKSKRSLLILANCSIILIMIAATIVHLIPRVPSGVLPLKIKPPVIPLMFMTIAIFNLATVKKFKRV
jgi:hypothetical protein